MTQTYSEIIESDVYWFNKIPKHWRICRLKEVAMIQTSNVDKKTNGGELLVRLCNYVDVYYNDNITLDIDFMEATASQTEIEKFRVFLGDVIITKDSETWDDIAIPAYISEKLTDVLCGYHLSIIRPDKTKIDGKYLFWSFCSRGINDQFRVSATGITRYGISRKWIEGSLFLVPEIDEQKQIASYLDKTCASIDASINTKRKQLEKLYELRKSIIHKAVIKGLDDSVEMKDSGVEWIGEIPKNWKVARLKDVAHIRYGLGQPPEKDEDGIPMIRATNIRAGRIVNNNLMKVDCQDLPIDRNPFLRKGEIVVVRSGAYTGDSAIIPSEYDGCISGYDMVVSTYKASSKFIAYGLLSYYILDAQILLLTLRAAQPHLNAKQLGSIMILLPDMIEEQNAIADYLDKKNEEISTIESNLEKQISTLEQYCKSLIHECVTGKRRITEQDLKKVGADV